MPGSKCDLYQNLVYYLFILGEMEYNLDIGFVKLGLK